jgi:hypothetical protein
LGLNVSNAGISPSYRTKYGTVSTKGFSIRPGIPGLSFRSSFGGNGKGSGAAVVLAVIAAAFALYVAAVIAYNVVLFLWWAVTQVVFLVRRQYRGSQEKKLIRNQLAVSKKK